MYGLVVVLSYLYSIKYWALLSFRYNAETDQVGISTTRFRLKDVSLLGRLFVWLYSTLRLIHIKHDVGENQEYVECSNFTVINLLLIFTGPKHERSVVLILLGFQVCICELLCQIGSTVIRFRGEYPKLHVHMF